MADTNAELEKGILADTRKKIREVIDPLPLSTDMPTRLVSSMGSTLIEYVADHLVAMGLRAVAPETREFIPDKDDMPGKRSGEWRKKTVGAKVPQQSIEDLMAKAKQDIRDGLLKKGAEQ